MTLSVLYVCNYGLFVYEGHAGFFASAEGPSQNCNSEGIKLLFLSSIHAVVAFGVIISWHDDRNGLGLAHMVSASGFERLGLRLPGLGPSTYP